MSAYMVDDPQISAVLNKGVSLGVLHPNKVQRAGQTMVNNNNKSLEACYGDKAGDLMYPHKYVHDSTVQVDDWQAHKYATCVAFQCSEYKTWKKSSSYRLLRAVQKAVEALYPGRDVDSATEDKHWCYH